MAALDCSWGREQANIQEINLLVDESCHWQAVEAIREGAPQPDVVAPLALVIEAINAIDGSALVVATQQEEVLWVLDLHGVQSGAGGQAGGQRGQDVPAQCHWCCQLMAHIVQWPERYVE